MVKGPAWKLLFFISTEKLYSFISVVLEYKKSMTGTSLFGITFITFSQKNVSIFCMLPTVHWLWTSHVQTPAQIGCFHSLWWKNPLRFLCWGIFSCCSHNKGDFLEASHVTHQMKFSAYLFSLLTFWRSYWFTSVY